MAWRITSFLLCQLAGAVLGWLAAGQRGAMVGVVGGAFGWFLVDLLRGQRLVDWLRRGGADEPPAKAGLWGDLAERMRRALRSRDQLAGDAEGRLQEFLAAIQASPNGVVLLDPRGRIEWCNETAATHLGIDPQRDLQQWIGNLLRDPAFAAYQAAGDYSGEAIIQGRDSSPMRPLRLSVQ